MKPTLDLEKLSVLHAELCYSDFGGAFNMDTLQEGEVTPERPCGTAACAAGIASIIFYPQIQFSPFTFVRQTAKVLGLTSPEAYELFIPSNYIKTFISPRMVASRIKKIINERENDEIE
jgi:hypothetical protein